jgi:predicted membrane protein
MKPLRLWVGLVLVAFGVFGILDATGTLDASQTIEKWWPVAIIGLGIIAMIIERRISLGPTIVVVIGVLLLAEAQEWTREDLFGPLILIAIGLMVLSGLRPRPAEDEHRENSLAMFGATKVKDRSEHFTHANVSAIFGGATLDLREAHIDHTAEVEALAMCGGVDVLVPKGWKVELDGMPILGGLEDKTEDGHNAGDAPVLNVHATAIMGGVDVKNKVD